MSILDLFKTRKYNKINDHTWTAIWGAVKTPPSDDASERDLYPVFVGTLLYATRYQAALAAGMEETVAVSVALAVVGKANFDAAMEDQILTVFSADPQNRAAGYAAALNAQVAVVAGMAKTSGAVPSGGQVDAALEEIRGLAGLLGEVTRES